MAEFPALPLFTDAYLADTEHLSDEEHGVYLKLLIAIWRSPNCRIPDDDDWLARKFRRDANAVRTHMRPLMREFCECSAGWVTQKRLLKEWEWCMRKRANNSDAAKARWNKEKGPCERISERNAGDAMRSQCPPPHPTLNQRKVDKLPSSGGSLTPLPFSTLPADWKDWAIREKVWDEGTVADVWAQFHEYWTDGKGKGRKYINWLATWRNWCRKENIKPQGGRNEITRRINDGGPDLAAQPGRAGGKPTWQSEGDRLAAKYRAQAQSAGQGGVDQRHE